MPAPNVSSNTTDEAAAGSFFPTDPAQDPNKPTPAIQAGPVQPVPSFFAAPPLAGQASEAPRSQLRLAQGKGIVPSPDELFEDGVVGLYTRAVDVSVAIAKFAGGVLKGGISLTLGSSGGAPIPQFDNQEEADAAMALGVLAEGPEDLKRQRDAVTFAGSMLVGGVTGAVGKQLVAKSVANGGRIGALMDGVMGRVAASMSRDIPAGAAFGAVRESENTLNAVLVDAAIFGGFGLAMSMFARTTKPINLAADNVMPATSARSVSRGGRNLLEVEAERGKMLYEEIDEIAGWMTTKGLPDAAPTIAMAGLPIEMGVRPSVIGALRALIGSPSRWKEVGGLTGEVANRVVTNAQERQMFANRVWLEANALFGESEKALFKDIPVTATKKRAKLKLALAESLDNVFSPADLPATLSPNVKAAFELQRGWYERVRAVMAAQGDIAPTEWGINGYFPHVFIGDYVIKDAQTGGIKKILKWGDVKGEAEKLLAANPKAQLIVEPRSWQMTSDLGTEGLRGRAFEELTQAMQAGMSLTPEEVASLVRVGTLGAERGAGRKFFQHTLERRADLPGFLTDPFQAGRIYARGAARRIAFYDFEAKTDMLIGALKQQPGSRAMGPTIRALEGYRDRIMGRPGQGEASYRASLEKMAQESPDMLRPILEGVSDPRKVTGTVNYLSAMFKLGWSAPSIYAQASQTVINTSSSIGYKPVIRAVRLLMDRSQHDNVQKLLRAMDLELMVPLGTDIYRPIAAELNPLHPLYMFNGLDKANRAIAGLARYQDEIMKGSNAEQALRNAKKFINETQFDYSIADAPYITAGPTGSVLFQFKKFQIKEMEFVWGLRKDPAALARFTANATVMGGAGVLLALPPLALLDWATGEVLGERPSEFLKRKGAESDSPFIQKLVGFGAPGVVADVDVSRSIEVGIPTEVGGAFGPVPTDLFALARDVISPALLDLIRQKGGQLTPKDRERVLRQIMPLMVKRILDARRIVDDRIVRVGGTEAAKFYPESPDREALTTGLGFQSLTRSMESTGVRVGRRIVEQYKASQQAIIQKLTTALLDGDDERVTALLNQASEDGIFITGAQVKGAQERALMDRFTRLVKRAPRELRERLLKIAPAGTTFNP